MLFFGILRNAIWTLFTILSHDFTLWKWIIKRCILGVSFGSTSRVPSESAKFPQQSAQTRKEVEKGSQNGSLLRWKNPGKGVDKRLEGSFLDFPMVRCVFGVQFTKIFVDLENYLIWHRIWLVSATCCSLCTSAPDVTTKKNTRVPPCISWLRLASQMPAERVSVLDFRLKTAGLSGGPFPLSLNKSYYK